MKEEKNFSESVNQTRGTGTTVSKLLTREAVAQRLQVCVRSVDNYRRTLGLPFVRIGNLIRFREEDLESWLRKREGKTA